MKKIFSILMLGVAAVLAFTACSPETEEKFELSSSERADAYMKQVKQILEAAPNGWYAEYYANLSYGGYTIFMDFENGKATLAAEKLGSKHVAGVDANGELIKINAEYKIEQSMGAILSFNYYNDVLHYFAEPKNPDGYGDSGDGMGGDFEFRVMSASADSVILSGKKHQAKIKMYPVKDGDSWQNIYDDVTKMETSMASRSYNLKKNGESMGVQVVLSNRCLVCSYDDEEGVAQRVALPYIVTRDGYKLYRNYELKGDTISGFTYDADGYHKEINNPNIVLETQTLTPYEHLTTSEWFIMYDNLGEFAQPFWDTFRTGLEKAGTNQSKATLYWAFIGKYNGKIGYHMNAGGDQATIGFNISDVSDDGTGSLIKMSYNSKDCNKAGTNFYDKWKLKEALKPFIGNSKTSSRTFKVTSDNERRPTYLLLTDVNEPTNVIKLLADEMYYPFGDEPKE